MPAYSVGEPVGTHASSPRPEADEVTIDHDGPVPPVKPASLRQMPATHVLRGGQAMPHMPQFDGSYAVLVHMPEQFVSPAGHESVQTLAVQTSPDAHTWPHAPQ